MAKANEPERETLRQAAEAAKALLPKFERKVAELQNRIASLRAVIDAHGALSGRRARSVAPGEPRSAKVKRGDVGRHIDQVLGEGTYEEPEIRHRLVERFQVGYSRGTVYSALSRGKKSGRYEVDDKKRWGLKH
jgi:hypothetical protein